MANSSLTVSIIEGDDGNPHSSVDLSTKGLEPGHVGYLFGLAISAIKDSARTTARQLEDNAGGEGDKFMSGLGLGLAVSGSVTSERSVIVERPCDAEEEVGP